MTDCLIEQKELKEFSGCLRIRKHKYLYDIMNCIDSLQKSGQQYRIELDFDFSSELWYKLCIVNDISDLDACHRVGVLEIQIHDSNQLSQEFIKRISDLFHNIYYIRIRDLTHYVHQDIHSQIMQLVTAKKLSQFKLEFQHGELSRNHEGIDLVKKYNHIIEQQQNLQDLSYTHSQINFPHNCRTPDQIIEYVKQQ